MKIRRVGAELFHADRRTDRAKVTVAFRNFENALKKKTQLLCFVVLDCNLMPKYLYLDVSH